MRHCKKKERPQALTEKKKELSGTAALILHHVSVCVSNQIESG